MDPSSLYPTLVLKVNLGCCRACVVKMDNLLEKTDGVHAFDIAPEAGLVTVWGKVDPAKLIKKIKKFNRNAELLSYEEPKKNAPERVSVGQQTNNDHHHMEGNSGASHGHGDHHAPPLPNFHPPLHPHYPPSPPPDWRPPPPPPPPDWQPQPPPPPPPHYYGPHHVPTNYNNMSHYFNDENTTGCLIM